MMEQFEVLNAALDRLESSNLRVMPRQPISTTLSEQTLANVLISLDACANHFDGQAREFARQTLVQVQKEVGNG